MDDIKTYIQGHLKMIKGLDMSDLIDACGISRAKFYKCLKEPWRFEDIDLERIAQRMSLDTYARGILFAYKHNNTADAEDTSVTEEIMVADDTKNLHGLAEKFIFEKQGIRTDCSRKMFSLLREQNSSRGNTISSSDELVREICDDLGTDGDMAQIPLVDIRIINAHTDGMIDVIFSLLQSFCQNVGRNDVVSVMHYIGETRLSRYDRLSLYSDWHQLMAYCQYQMQFTDRLEKSFFASWNGCVIRYVSRKRSCKYLMINIHSRDDAVVFSFSDENLFEFMRHGCVELFNEDSASVCLATNAIGMAEVLEKCKQNYQTIALTHGLCAEDILPELYDALLEKVLSAEANRDQYNTLINEAGANDLHEMFGMQQTLRVLTDSFKHRHEADKKAGVIHLLSARELKRFALCRQNADMKLVGLNFSKVETIKQLRYIKSNLEGTQQDGRHHYFLTNPSKAITEKKLLVFRNYDVAIASGEDGSFRDYYRSLTDPALSDALYGYIVDKLLPEECRSTPFSPVMGKAVAEEFIDGLIQEVERTDA